MAATRPAVSVVVDRVGAGLPDDGAVADVPGPDEAERGELLTGDPDQALVVEPPDVVAPGTEILEPVAGGDRVGDHPRRPHLEVLDAPDADAGSWT